MLTAQEIREIENLAKAMTLAGRVRIIECADVGKALERLLADRKALVEVLTVAGDAMNAAYEHLQCGNGQSAEDRLSDALTKIRSALQEDR